MSRVPGRMLCFAYTLEMVVFDWDRNNLKKIEAHRLKATESGRGPIPRTCLGIPAGRRQ
jgi:hypothetical protein